MISFIIRAFLLTISIVCFLLTIYFTYKQSYEWQLKFVKRDGWFIKHVDFQTPEICLAAVKQNGYVLQFVKNQTEEICLAAINNCPEAIKFVKDKNADWYRLLTL